MTTDITLETEMSKNRISTDVNNDKIDESVVEFHNRCGLFRWRPECLQKCRSIYLFLAVVCCSSSLQTALCAGYFSSQITTLERRFALDSYNLGIIQSFFEVGFITCALFVSFFGTRGRKPLWISFGMFALCIGAFLMTVPEFLSELTFEESEYSKTFQICRTNRTQNADGCSLKQQKNLIIVKTIFIIGQFIFGAGTSPLLSLGPTYIDDHVSPSFAAPLIALIYASAASGPVFGYIIGALMLRQPVRRGVLPHNAEPGDHTWIGAWWAGYQFLGIIAFILAIILAFFPRRVRKVGDNAGLPKIELSMDSSISRKSKGSPVPDNNDMGYDVEEDDNYGKNAKDLPKAIKNLLCNKVFLLLTIAVCFEMFLINGFASFLPKYIETEYKVTNIVASFIAGGIIVPAGALGIFCGGLIMHKFKLKRKQAVIFTLCGVAGIITCMVIFFFIGCPPILIAGINVAVPYLGVNFTHIQNNSCVLNNCEPCDDYNYLPVCDESTGITYFSGCHAGCTNYTKNPTNNFITYYNCQCNAPADYSVLDPNKMMINKECPLKCSRLAAFICFLVVALFLTGLTQNPILMVTIRSVKKHERAFALGFQFTLLRLFGYIPSPILFGYVIDAACDYWKYSMCSATNKIRGDCLLTDPIKLTKNLIGLCIILKCGAFIFYALLLWALPRSRPAVKVIRSNRSPISPDDKNLDPVTAALKPNDGSKAKEKFRLNNSPSPELKAIPDEKSIYTENNLRTSDKV